MAKILICEDTLDLQKLLKMYLSKKGHEVSQAFNGQEALEKFKESIPDLIITDMVMPLMDGFEFIETLKNQGSTVPIVVLSSIDTESVREECKKLGVKDYLIKPIKIEVLNEILQKFVNP